MLPHGRTMRALSALVGTCRASWAREASLGRRGIKNGPTSLTKFLRESYKRFNDQMFGETTIQERYDEFVKDLKFINADVTKYIDGFEPMRIDIGQKVNRFMKVHSDAEYGGLSNCSTEVRIGDRVVDRSDESEASYVRFKGELRFPVHEDAKVKTNGFCAAQAVCRRVLDLSDYEGFELILRSKDTRDYIFGLKTMSLAMLSDMQYQIKLEVPGGNEWTYFHIPWSYFSLTRGGRLCEIQRVSENLKLESMTFLVLRDQGPFQLDIGSITAHPRLDRAVINKRLPYGKGEYGSRGRL